MASQLSVWKNWDSEDNNKMCCKTGKNPKQSIQTSIIIYKAQSPQQVYALYQNFINAGNNLIIHFMGDAVFNQFALSIDERFTGFIVYSDGWGEL